tara:strand:- start:1 stop:528 length:528 start_codon:yes stop_codon:yes gene_type:complete
MFQLAVVSGIEIMQNDPCCYRGEWRVIQPKTLQCSRLELMLDKIMSMGLCEHPILQRGSWNVIPEQRSDVSLTFPVDKPLFGFEASKDAVNPSRISFGSLKFTSTQVEQSEPNRFHGPMNGSDVVVGFALENVVMHDQPRRDQFCDATLHKAFGSFWIFQLVANGDFQSRFDKLG